MKNNPDIPLINQFDSLIGSIEKKLDSAMLKKFEEAPVDTAVQSMGLIAAFAKLIIGDEDPEVKAMCLLVGSDELREEIENNKEYVLEQLAGRMGALD